MLFVLCEKNLLVLDFDIYEIHTNFELKTPAAQKLYLDYVDKSYKLLIVNKNSISVYDIAPFTNSKAKIKFIHIFEIDKSEQITNKNILFMNNLIIFETKIKLNFYRVDYNLPKDHTSKIKSICFMKKDISIYKTDMTSNYNDSSMKFNEYSKDITFNYSKLTNCLYLTFLNKIFVVKNNFTGIFLEEFEVLEKITKQSYIFLIKIEDPYIFIGIEGKIYIHFILNIEKCIEFVNLESPISSYNFQQAYMKNLNFLHGIGKINFESGLILYADDFHLNRVRVLNPRDPEYILNSSQYLLVLFDFKNLKFEWISSSTFEEQYPYLKNLNFDFATKFLAYFNKQNLSQMKTFESNRICLQNNKFFMKKSLEFFFMTFSSDYIHAKKCQDELNVDMIFLAILMKRFIHSDNLNILLHFLFCLKFSDKTNIEKLISAPTLDLINEISLFIENYTSLALIKNEKDLFTFLKSFFSKFVSFRNEIKSRIEKEKRKKIDCDKLIESLTDELKSQLKENEFRKLYDPEGCDSLEIVRVILENWEKLNNFLSLNNFHEEELTYLVVENLVFLMNYYTFKITKNQKYQDSMKLMIKVSHQILDQDLIKILKELNLEEEILLFYYYKGNYSKCINNIITIYESLDKISTEDLAEEEQNLDTAELDLGYNRNNILNYNLAKLDENSSNTSSNDNSNYNEHTYTNNNRNSITDNLGAVKNRVSLEKIKTQWLSRYVNLISIIGDKMTTLEFYEYVKWALSKNHMKTIDILFENGKISKEKLDMDFINLLKINGIDPVIHYLKKFLIISDTGNEDVAHHNEMINLYTIKLKLLLEVVEKETKQSENSIISNSEIKSSINVSNMNLYRWNKKILSNNLKLIYFFLYFRNKGGVL